MSGTGDDNVDDMDDSMEEKHPYIQMAFNKEYMNQKDIVKTSTLSQTSIKDYQHKEKNLLSDLPDPQNQILNNGVELHLKKVFGQYQNPIQKPIHFISKSNYIAVHNLLKDETKYIGIDCNLADITTFEVQTADTILKGFSFAPQPQQQLSSFSPKKDLYSPGSQGPHNGTFKDNSDPQAMQTQTANTSIKELQALIAYGEKAKETFMKEQKFSSKKVYGITNSLRKKANSKPQESPIKARRSQSPSPQKEVNLSQEENLQLRYIVKVNVFTLNNPSKKYVLSHVFDDYFYVQQIQLREKESLCYTLCSNIYGEQIFFIWNFRKETVIGYVEMKAKINKFMVSDHKSELILFLGQRYLKYYEANFTNKLIKENNNNIIPMKIEKESNFVDIDYLPKQDLFVIVTDNNCAFVYEKNVLKHRLTDLKIETKDIDSVRSDSLEIGEKSEDEQNKGDEHLIIQSQGTNEKKKAPKKQSVQKDKIMLQDEDDDDSFQEKLEEKQVQGEEMSFMRVVVTQKGFVIGSNIGYIFYYEFQKEDAMPKLISQVHISNKIKGIVSMSLSRGAVNDDYQIAVAGVYPKFIKSKLIQQVIHKQQSRKRSVDQTTASDYESQKQNFFMPKTIMQRQTVANNKVSFVHKRKSSHTINKEQLRLVQSQEVEEKLEFFIVNMKSMLSQQLNQVVEKIFNKGSHDGSIYQVVQSKNKSCFYTLSEGNVLKIWNHTNEWKGVASFNFDEQPISVDVHPSSWQIALGFKSGVKIYQNLDKQLKLQFEKFGKACFAITYADGGHLLACTNAVYIEIIDPMRMQLLMTLFGHTGLVRCLQWTHNSQYLVSACNNGNLLVWKGNFKEQMACSNSEDIVPQSAVSDKNYVYIKVAYDETLDVIIAHTTTSLLRILMNNGQECIHEEDLLKIPSYGEQNNNQNEQLKVTCMTFSKALSCIAVGYSNGRVGVLNWPIAPNKKTFKYDVYLQNKAITDLMFTYSNRYLVATSDDGSIYVMETFKINKGIEKNWIAENHERQLIQKKRETNGFRGFSITDNLIMCNQQQLLKVNQRIEKLEMQIKTQEVNYTIKEQKKLKKFEKQMKMIDKDLKEELLKQDKLIEATKIEFDKERSKLERIRDEQLQEHEEEKRILIENKVKNLNFVSNENDELETKILRLKETIIDELEKIEQEHTTAIDDLVASYENSIRQAQVEVRNTIEKLKQNGQYYEQMIGLQEKDYEGEVNRFQTDLVEAQCDFKKKKDEFEEKIGTLKNEHQTIEDTYKENNALKKEKFQQVLEMEGGLKFKENNIERLNEKQVASSVFIEDKEKAIFESHQEKKQLENLIVFLSSKIKELKLERKPQEQKKKDLELLIENTYKELQQDFQFRKYMELKEESLIKKMSILSQEIKQKNQLKENIDAKVYVFKRELSYLAETSTVKGWDHKMQGMMKCMSEVLNAVTSEDVKKISIAFIHIAEVIESNSRNYRQQDEDDVQAKQYKLNDMELAYYRNKNSEKLTEMQFRYKALFSQLEKQIKKLRNDNVKLIEEFNTLTNEHKKLNNLRRMIKESIKEIMGENLKEEMLNSSDEDNFRGGSKKKDADTSKITRSKSSAQLSVRQPSQTQQLQGEISTARDLYQPKNALPDLRQSTIGAKTQRDMSDGKKHLAGGFMMNKNAQIHKRRLINSISHKAINSNPGSSNKKYLDKIVQEFQKNKQEIENQTKAMENVQRQMNVMLNNPVLQSMMPAGISTNNQIPTLNLKSIQNSNNSSGKPSMTTRIPNTTERTAVSILDQAPSIGATTRRLPIIKESKDTKMNVDEF